MQEPFFLCVVLPVEYGGGTVLRRVVTADIDQKKMSRCRKTAVKLFKEIGLASKPNSDIISY